MICSTIATSSLEEIARASPGQSKWFQLYIYKDRFVQRHYEFVSFVSSSAVTTQLLRRVEACPDFKAIVLTVDTPYFGKRRADVLNDFAVPTHLR